MTSSDFTGSLPYDLDNPDAIYQLNEQFIELSGIYPAESDQALLFVQDEAVQIHRLDLATGKTSSYPNHGLGDAEALVCIGNTAYILLAGDQPMILQIENYASTTASVERYAIGLASDFDPEGLCYDKASQQLLIACKASPDKNATTRQIFAFDLTLKQRLKMPLYNIDYRDFLKKKKHSFNPSGIAINPVTNDIYIIGTKSRKLLLRYDRQWRLQHMVKLKKSRLPQPEGITFSADGDLYLASEGKHGKPATVSVYRMQLN